MSEIKSAIELAMERTRNLVMDDEEKRQASVRDREQKMTALLRRFMENMIDERRFLNEYELIAGDPGLKVPVIMDALAEGIETYGGDQRLFRVMHITCEDALGDEIGILEKRLKDEIEGQEVRVRLKVEKRLQAMGVSGSAVEPNIVGWDEWKEAVDQGKHIFKEQVAVWKERFKAARS